VKEGSKINLIRRVCDSTSQAADKPGLRDTMLAFLLKHMPPNSALKVLDEFMKVSTNVYLFRFFKKYAQVCQKNFCSVLLLHTC